MIDTERYEGHTEGRWYVDDSPDVIHPTIIYFDDPQWFNDFIIAELVMANAEEWTEEDYANARLIADAPLLLAEVRRLQSYIAHHDGDVYRQCPECGSLDFTFKFDDEGMHCDCDACDNEWKVKIE